MRIILVLALACAAWGADSPDRATWLGSQARKAQDSGQLVQAYILFGQAAAADPSNAFYKQSREALAPLIRLLTKAEIETATPAPAAQPAEQPNPFLPKDELIAAAPNLQSLPQLQVKDTLADFNLRAESSQIYKDVASIFGVDLVFDHDFSPKTVQFEVGKADFRATLEALTAATGTFVFPVSPHTLYVAQDTVQKRAELEPNTLVTVNVPQAMTQQMLVEAATAVKTTLSLRNMAWDTANHEVVIVDKASRAVLARSLLQSLLLPKGQVRIEVQIFTLDRQVSYNHGLSLQTAFQIWDFGHIGGFQSVLSTASSSMNFLAFGSGVGPALFGVSLASATLFGTFSDSFAKNVYDANVIVTDGQTADMHVGDKYPIPTSTYSGYQQSGGSSLYNPIGQVNLEDLGLILKLTPRITSEDQISIDIEADYKTLGTQSIDSVPEINERQFKGNVRMTENQSAILAGLDQSTSTFTRTGLIGLTQIPGLNQVLSNNTREQQTEKTLIVIKPVITIFPMSTTVSPQFFLGPLRGLRVIL